LFIFATSAVNKDEYNRPTLSLVHSKGDNISKTVQNRNVFTAAH